MGSLSVATGLLLAALLLQEKRAPAPDPAALKDAAKTIRDIFKDDYARKAPADRLALARKFIEQAAQSKDDPASRFTLLSEAQDLAAGAGDAGTAMTAIDRLVESFEVDGVSLRAAALTSLAKIAKSPEDSAALARAYLKLADAAVIVDDYDAARKACDAASALFKKIRDLPGVQRAEAQGKEIADLKGRHDRVRKARETITKTPDDPAANLALGQFHCFIKGDWETGLPQLSAGSDAALRTLAAKDLAGPSTPLDQSVVGDGWWDLAEKETGRSRRHLRDRARHWYEKASEKLVGLLKTKVDQRLSQLLTESLAQGDWLDLTDSALFSGAKGKTGEPVLVSAPQGLALKSKLTTFPAGEFDAVTARIRIGPEKDLVAFLQFSADRSVYIQPSAKVLSGAVHNPAIDEWKASFSIEPKKVEECIVLVLLKESQYWVYLDGKEVGRIDAKVTRIQELALSVQHGSARFDQIRLRRKQQ